MHAVIPKSLDMIGLMPCPLKVPFEALSKAFVEYHRKQTGETLNCIVESNANKDMDFFSTVTGCQDIDDFPGIMMAPGFNYFFHRSFREKFGEYFTMIGDSETNPALSSIGLADPEKRYNIPCFNPTLLVVDRTVHRDLPEPRRWTDLLEPEYAGLVGLRGHQGGQFCEGLMLNIYRERGEEGVRLLGRCCKTPLHPSQMVKFAGSGKQEAPAVSTIPYSFSRMVKTSDTVSVIWPEDGAIINPFVMLVKKSALDKVGSIAEFITGPDVGTIFAEAYFPAFNREVENKLPPGAGFKWLGWDFIRQNDLGELVPHLEDILRSAWRGQG